MASGNYEYQSDFARRYFGQGKAEGIAEGKAEGIAEGKAEGKAEAVLAVLAARQIAVPDEIRARIATCADVALLDRWLARAVTALAAADVVRE
jgi:flagellar biosynthesis/type III secretory pathway protein FliH